MNIEIIAACWIERSSIGDGRVFSVLDTSEDGKRDLIEFELSVGVNKFLPIGDERLGMLIKSDVERLFNVQVMCIDHANLRLEDLY